MPEIHLRGEEAAPRKLSAVPEFEVWEDEHGNAVWHNGQGYVCVVRKSDALRGHIRATTTHPGDVTVVRKISDPIIVRW